MFAGKDVRRKTFPSTHSMYVIPLKNVGHIKLNFVRKSLTFSALNNLSHLKTNLLTFLGCFPICFIIQHVETNVKDIR